MNNRIVNFQLKKVVNQDVRGGFGTSVVVVDPFAALHPAININYSFTPPPPCFNSKLTSSHRCSTIACFLKAIYTLISFPIALTRTALVRGFCAGISSIPMRVLLAGPLSPCKPYPMNCVRRSTLDFQTGKQPKVLNLFRGDAFTFSSSGPPESMDTKLSIVNSDQTDNRYDCLSQNAGTHPLTVFALIALKPKGANDANRVQHIPNPARCVPIANAIGLVNVLAQINIS